MLIIKTNQPNTLVVTVSQNSELPNPEYLFSFTHIFSKQNVSFIPTDISTHKSRYDEFFFVEGTGVGQIPFPYQGQYLYAIYEQPAGSGNLNPALAFNVVENGDAQVFPSSASTMDSQYDIFISSNEDNSNVIFAPDELNPTPNITPSPTTTPNQPTPTPTPSITPTLTPTQTNTPSVTPTFTPTPSSTPAIFNPSDLGALWWVDYTDVNNVVIDNTFPSNNLSGAKDLISNNFIFSAITSLGPQWSGTGYNSVSGVTFATGDGLSNALSVYNGISISAYTTFANVRYTGLAGGNLIQSDNEQNYLGEQQGYRWFSIDGFASSQPNIRTYTFFDNGNSVSPEPRTEDLDPNDWYFVASRVYLTGITTVTEISVDGLVDDDVIISGVQPRTSTTPIFSLARNGSREIQLTEQFFFDRALSDSEMTQMFNYLQAKYPLQ
jgi:hypothetical protein